MFDAELYNRDNIPFSSEYVKYRLLPDDSTFITIEEIWENIQQFPFIPAPTYQEVIKMIFEWIKEGFIKQEFDEFAEKEDDRRIKLRLI